MASILNLQVWNIWERIHETLIGSYFDVKLSEIGTLHYSKLDNETKSKFGW